MSNYSADLRLINDKLLQRKTDPSIDLLAKGKLGGGMGIVRPIFGTDGRGALKLSRVCSSRFNRAPVASIFHFWSCGFVALEAGILWCLSCIAASL